MLPPEPTVQERSAHASSPALEIIVMTKLTILELAVAALTAIGTVDIVILLKIGANHEGAVVLTGD